jgi:oligopeptide transport system ATP-binding protein
MIFQDPMSSLNPIMRIGKQITEVIRLKKGSSPGTSATEARLQALKLMQEVGITDPERCFGQYPFQLSGGMRQRIVIAIALAGDPEILICDEPTTALDVTIQAQILDLIDGLKRSRGLSVIFITHDFGVVARMADRIAVMYAGKIVECGTAEDIFYDPRHPYTWALLCAVPDLDTVGRLPVIGGTPPNLVHPPAGDTFAVYPGQDGAPLESVRMLTLVEALQDYRAMKLAEKYYSHQEVVAAIEAVLGEPITFKRCAHTEEEMLKIREAVNEMIKKALK